MNRKLKKSSLSFIKEKNVHRNKLNQGGEKPLC